MEKEKKTIFRAMVDVNVTRQDATPIRVKQILNLVTQQIPAKMEPEMIAIVLVTVTIHYHKIATEIREAALISTIAVTVQGVLPESSRAFNVKVSYVLFVEDIDRPGRL
jgi:hypothetical protein